MTKDIKMTSQEYFDSLICGLWDLDEAQDVVDEMRNAKIGTLKANCWEKIDDDLFIIFAE